MSETKDDDLDVNAALEQLLEFQRKIDDLAKRTVERVKRMIESRETLQPGCSAAFAKRHGKWYDATQRGFVAAGFQPLGEYENANSRDRPDDTRSFYRFALSADRTVVASFFLVPTKEPRHCIVLESSAADGSAWITGSGVTDTGLPTPPNRAIRVLPGDMPVKILVDRHRKHVMSGGRQSRTFDGIADILDARTRDAEEISEYRRGLGLGLFEPMLRTMYGDRFDDEGMPVLESIHNHPEWWTGEEAPKPVVAPSDAPLRIMFLMSREDEDRRHITSAGLAAYGLPELQMKALAANHCRAARFLMGAVARKLVAHASGLAPSNRPMEDRLSGIEVALSRDEAMRGRRSPMFGAPPVASGDGSATVRLELEEFGGPGGSALDILSVLLAHRRTAKLLRVKPASGVTESPDVWLRDVCHRLGMHTPVALPFSALDETMLAASREAVNDLEALRTRLRNGLPDGQSVAIKTGLITTRGTREYVWVRVREWPAGAFVGALEVEPEDCPEFAKGQTVRVADADVFDYALASATEGALELARTDVVALDFGIDLPG